MRYSYGLVERSGSTTRRVRHPPFFTKRGNMSVLSIFIDESGDFGQYDYRAPYYIISMVFHNQKMDLSEAIRKLEYELSNLGLDNHCIHAGPIIRAEEEYRYISIEDRRKVFKRITGFTRNLSIKCESFYIEKKHIKDGIEASGKLSKIIAKFVREHYEFFLSFDSVKVYYDNGQVEVNKILAAVFSTLLDNVEFRKVIPSDYRLFQVADLVCTLKLVELKLDNHTLSRSEIKFFENDIILRKNYLKPISIKKFDT